MNLIEHFLEHQLDRMQDELPQIADGIELVKGTSPRAYRVCVSGRREIIVKIVMEVSGPPA